MTKVPSDTGGNGLPATAPAGSLYVVATPIGHLADLGPRAADVLRTVAVVAAEDTRTSRVLLEHVGSHARPVAAHRHNEREAGERIVALLAQGHDVALVSDAGTPAISDPGARIVAMARRAGYRVVPIPGPCAPVALLSACGLVEGAFHFEGFLPARAGPRDARLATLARMPHPFVLLEAPHRIARTVPAIAAACGPERWIAFGRELTKRFEEIHVCRAGEGADWLAADPHRERGEYVLVVAAPDYDARRDDAGAPRGEEAAVPCGEVGGSAVTIEISTLLVALLEALPLSQAVRVAQRTSGLPHRELYRMALDMQRPKPQ